MGYFDIANSSLLYTLVIIGIIYILLQSLVFLRHAYRHSQELSIDKQVIRRIVKSSAVFSIVPSISIVLGLAALAPSLGIPWSWFRLSVIGNVSYELMAANMASSSLGFATLADAVASGPSAFGAISLAMCTGVSGALILDIFLISRVSGTVAKLKARSSDFGVVALSVLYFAVLVVFTAPIFGSGIVKILTFFTSMAVVFIQMVIIKKLNQGWLKNFVLAFALILGMCSSLLWTHLFA